MIELGALVLLGIAGLALVFALLVVLKAVLWIVLLPVRLVFWLLGTILLLPLLLIKFFIGGVILLIALPVIVISLIAASAALVAGVLLPALPVILLFALLWYLVRPQPQALVRS
jgi:hypothetical protein